MTLDTAPKVRPLCPTCLKYARYDFRCNWWTCPVCMKRIGDEKVAFPKPVMN